MAFQGYLVLGLLVLLDLLTNGIAVSPSHDTASLNRTSFPKDFIFGTASAAYQYEGAAKEGGRGPSTWDIFTHRYPGKIANGSNGDIAVDQYHCYKGDVRIMKKMGLDAYRFSISWSRVLPKGKLSGGVNREGIKYYNKLINRLLARGIQPFVTLLHLDPPQTLEDEYGGFLSPHIMNDFRDYAELCFKEFGDRVKHWITLNEPLSYTNAGYVMGTSPPGRCSSWQQLNCTGGDSGTEPYLVSHNQLLAHASAVKIYKQKYQQVQKGIMGISLNTDWYVPFSNARHDHDAALRALDFKFGWFMDPLTNGDYPHSMRSLVGDRLPKFTKHQSKLVKGSLDFLGLNYYTANYVADALHSKVEHASYITDLRANISSERNGIPIGPKAFCEVLSVRSSSATSLGLCGAFTIRPRVIHPPSNMFEARVGMKDLHPLQRHRILPKLKVLRSRQGRHRLKIILRLVEVGMISLPLSVKIRSRDRLHQILGATAVRFSVISAICSIANVANMEAHQLPTPCTFSSKLLLLPVGASGQFPDGFYGVGAASEWLRLYPKGIRDLLLYIKTKYHDPLIFITENGTDEFNDPTLSLEEALADNYRIDYFYRHFQYIHRAIKDGVNVKGYFAWSLLDNFEWNSGYTVRFGINYVDYKNGLKRHPKLSALWFKKFLKK
uniref:Uncharacterized protein n=1 Tax=Quercus lobata TaxID=97700 RepID=A0A7N2QX25_QUELO